MGIKSHRFNLLLFILIVAGFGCSKKNNICPKMGYEFTYFKPGIIYTPFADSISLGDSIILEASAPRTFFVEEKSYTVTLNKNEVFGPLVIKKATNDPLIPIVGAANDVILTPHIGNVVKDSAQFTNEQLKIGRTTYCILEADSFKIKLSIKPMINGIFFISLNQQGNRDDDCALYKYLLKVKNSDQHLYYLAQANNGIIYESDRNFVYCFKVY
jgi:hypothetical protein